MRNDCIDTGHRHIPSFCVVGLSIACRVLCYGPRARSTSDGTRRHGAHRGDGRPNFGCVDREILARYLCETDTTSILRTQVSSHRIEPPIGVVFVVFVFFSGSPSFVRLGYCITGTPLCVRVRLGERRGNICPSLSLLLLC